jgi:ubiquinone/menaquinone biosynthesis C-methylase UbiE
MSPKIGHSNGISSHFLFKGNRMAAHRRPSPAVLKRRDIAHRELHKALARSVADFSPRYVLDVGTGYGTSVDVLARRFGGVARIWSIDASTEVIRSVRKTLKNAGLAEAVFLKKANAERMPFRSGHFDLVVSLLSLHHFANPSKAIREMRRVTSNQGRLIVADWKPTRSRVTPHSVKDIPTLTFVKRQLKQLGWAANSREGRYWYLVQASEKHSRNPQNH